MTIQLINRLIIWLFKCRTIVKDVLHMFPELIEALLKSLVLLDGPKPEFIYFYFCSIIIQKIHLLLDKDLIEIEHESYLIFMLVLIWKWDITTNRLIYFKKRKIYIFYK